MKLSRAFVCRKSFIGTLFLVFLFQNTFAQLPIDENGWTIINPSADSKIVYVSSSAGSDANNGTSAEAPVATIEKAITLVRDGYPDHILLKRGDTWIAQEGLGSFYSGRSASEPMVVGYYGKQGDRPLIKIEKTFFHAIDIERSHIAIIGIELYAYKHDPNSPEYESERGVCAIEILSAKGKNILIEDCKFNYLQLAAFTTKRREIGMLENIRLRRNITVQSWAGDSYRMHERRTRIQGLFVAGVSGILIEENLFDHNGWNQQVEGAGACMYNHNIYMAADNPNPEKIIIRNNTFARGAAHGLQVRSGGYVENNLFVGNAINLNVGYHKDPPMKGAFSEVRNNVFQEVRLMDSLNTDYPRTASIRGIGEITIPAIIENNIFSNCINEAQFAIDDYDDKWGFGGEVILKDNVAYKWTNKNDKPNPVWPDPERTIGDYHATIGGEASSTAFLLEARKRPLKTWWPAYAAPAVNDFFRAGFNLPAAKKESF